MAGAAEKADAVRELLRDGGNFSLFVDATVAGVVVPVRARTVTWLELRCPPRGGLSVTKRGVTATWRFLRGWHRTARQSVYRAHRCVLPWASVQGVMRVNTARPEFGWGWRWDGHGEPDPEPPADHAGRDFAGSWHWDDVRGSIDAVIACLPEMPRRRRRHTPPWFRRAARFADRLDTHDTHARADSTLVYRWGVELGELWGLPDPCAYGRALTNSQAIFRPSLSTREGLRLVYLSESEQRLLSGMVERSRIQRGLPIGDEISARSRL